MKLGLLIIFVPDLALAKHFYGTILGLHVKQQLENCVIFEVDGIELIAFKCRNHANDYEYASKAQSAIVFRVESLETTMKSLKDQAVKFIHNEPVQNFLGKYVAFVDPFGITHELLEREANPPLK